jgi:hypothetical protein
MDRKGNVLPVEVIFGQLNKMKKLASAKNAIEPFWEPIFAHMNFIRIYIDANKDVRILS